MIAASIFGTLLVVIGLFFIAVRTNQYAVANYGYTPFTLSNFLSVLPAYILAFIGFGFTHHSDPWNKGIFYAVTVIYIVVWLVRMTKRSDIGVAMMTLVLMAIAWLPIIAFVLIQMGGRDSERPHR